MQPKSGNSTTSTLMAVLFVITLLAVGSTYYFYNQYQQSQKIIKDPSALGRKQGEEIKAKLSQFMVLPNESPTIATITDVTQLQSQPFFKNAKNEDKLIIFPQAKKAILWRPSINKIIETAPVNIGQPASVAGQQTSVTPAVLPSKAPAAPTVTR